MVAMELEEIKLRHVTSPTSSTRFLSFHSTLSEMPDSADSSRYRPEYHSTVVGSGPGGLATVCALLDQGVEKIGWIDSKWSGGRLNGMYREISS